MEVEWNVQCCAKACVQTQGGDLVNRQDPAEHLEGQDMPAALGDC